MAIRTVRLDDDAENVLREIRETTGLPISEAFKRGLKSLRQQIAQESGVTPYDVYRQLDLGPGGYAMAPSTATKAAVRKAIRKKLRR